MLKTLTAAALILALIAYKCGDNQTHVCRWQHCPYQGQPIHIAHRVNNAINEPGTDAHCIDRLHLQHPSADYETLDSLLFNQQ